MAITQEVFKEKLNTTYVDSLFIFPAMEFHMDIEVI